MATRSEDFVDLGMPTEYRGVMVAFTLDEEA